MAQQMKNKTGLKQAERRQVMKKRIMEATLSCLSQAGYASTSITQIQKKSGVSRGGLLHHYPTKCELVAAAIDYFYRERQYRFEQQLLGVENEKISLRDRLLVFKNDIDLHFETTLEIVVAQRTNPELVKLVEKLTTVDDAKTRAKQYEDFFPQFSSKPSAQNLIGLLVCFLRGLSMEAMNSSKEHVMAIFDLFDEMLEDHITELNVVI